MVNEERIGWQLALDFQRLVKNRKTKPFYERGDKIAVNQKKKLKRFSTHLVNKNLLYLNLHFKEKNELV